MQDAKKKVILCFVSYYLPGFKSGGPLRTIANMVDHLAPDFDFWIVTRDRDLGDAHGYENIKKNTWTKVGLANVYYLPPNFCTTKNIASLMASTPHDLVYLNSVFDKNFTIKPLLIMRLFRRTAKPLIIAPRGEASTGALRLKRGRKLIYLWVSKLLGLYKGARFQASSTHELADIQQNLSISKNAIWVAADLPSIPRDDHGLHDTIRPEQNDAMSLRVVFLSRISPMKNLEFAISILKCVRVAVVFDIYGPIENTSYWNKCLELATQLPQNVQLAYCGTVMPENVVDIISGYDLFLLPTLGENYGHVIAEALSGGTPVLISDQTPWRDLADKGWGWDLSLTQDGPAAFAAKIDTLASQDLTARAQQRQLIKNTVSKVLHNVETIDSNRKLFIS